MPEAIYKGVSGYVTLMEAADKLGLHRHRFRVLAQEKGLKRYADPRDQRVILYRTMDVEWLREQLQPIEID